MSDSLTIVKLYSYNSDSSFTSFINKENNRNYIYLKDGLSIKQDDTTRILQQERETSNVNKLFKLIGHSVELDDEVVDFPLSELDNKVREYMVERTEYHNNDIRYPYYKIPDLNSNRKKHEFISLFIGDVVIKYGLENCMSFEEMFENDSFREELYDRHNKFKKDAITKVTTKTPCVDRITLSQHQLEQKEWMLSLFETHINFFWQLLSLCARYGKTYLVLELMEDLSKKYDNLNLLILSKNLASNNSFVISYKNVGYNFDIHTISLFQTETNVKKELSKLNLTDKNVVMITDEVDQASHTNESRNKINSLLRMVDFKLLSFILMSGTGISKGRKIVKTSTLSDSPIESTTVTYTDLIIMGTNRLVGRNFHYKKFDLNGTYTNILESMSDPERMEELVKFANNDFVTFNEAKRKKKGLLQTDVIQHFISCNTNQDLLNYAEVYRELYPDIMVEVIVSENGYTNGNAENRINKIISELKKEATLKNKKRPHPLLLLCKEMAQRSFSIPEINRVVIWKDGEVSDSTIQKMSRALTYKEGKPQADICVMSQCSFLEFKINMFEREEEVSKKDAQCVKNKLVQYFKNSTFTEHYKNGNYEVSNYEFDILSDMKIYDGVMKYKDTTNYIMMEWYGDNTIYVDDINVSTNSKNKKLSAIEKEKEDSIKKNIDPDDIIVGKTTEEKKYLARLEMLVEISRTLPWLLRVIDKKELFEIGIEHWNIFFNKVIPYKVFRKNLESENYMNTMSDIISRANFNDKKLGWDMLEKISEIGQH